MKFNITNIFIKPLARFRLEELAIIIGIINIPKEPQANNKGEDSAD